MKKCETCDPFENYDALVILTRQGVVMTSTDAKLTFAEDDELYRLNKSIAERTERMKREEKARRAMLRTFMKGVEKANDKRI